MSQNNQHPITPKCIACTYFDVERNLCNNKNGKLAGIPLSEALASADHDCEAFNEAEFKVMPKGLLWLALHEADIDVTTEQLTVIWDSFVESMEQCGFLATSTEEEINNH